MKQKVREGVFVCAKVHSHFRVKKNDYFVFENVSIDTIHDENTQILWPKHKQTGDIAYQDDYLFGEFAYERILDSFMEEMEFTSAYKPYMVLPGNHEGKY